MNRIFFVDTKRLKKITIDVGLNTIEEIAAATDISRPTVSSVLSGEIRPSTIVIEKFAKGLGMNSNQVGEIFFKTNLSNTQV